MSETLFDPGPGSMRRSADIHGEFRYSLHRDWHDYSSGQRPRWVTFVMLNPSTADGDRDDPTIRRCIGFAQRLGGTGLAVVNLYAYRATQPTELWIVPDPVGPLNNETLGTFLGMAQRYDMPIIAAWGAHARPDRVEELLAMPGSDRLTTLGVTLAGAPKHPLARGHHRIPDDAVPQPWRMP